MSRMNGKKTHAHMVYIAIKRFWHYDINSEYSIVCKLDYIVLKGFANVVT